MLRKQKEKKKIKRGKKSNKNAKNGATTSTAKKLLKSGKAKLRLKNSARKGEINIIKSGRYYQEQSIRPATKEAKTMEIEAHSVGDQTTMIAKEPANAMNEDDGVKGGSKNADKQPFYSRAQPQKPSVMSDEEEIIQGNNSTSSGGESIEGVEDESEERIDDAKEPEFAPKRVGDDDVEEDGDTVMVEPKSDGVDDDPDPNDYEEDNELSPGNQSGERNGNNSPTDETDERGRRVNREKSNKANPSERTENSEDNQGGSGVIGGGVGTTTGVNGKRKGVAGSSVDKDDDDGADDSDGGNDHSSADGNEADYDTKRTKIDRTRDEESDDKYEKQPDSSNGQDFDKEPNNLRNQSDDDDDQIQGSVGDEKQDSATRGSKDERQEGHRDRERGEGERKLYGEKDGERDEEKGGEEALNGADNDERMMKKVDGTTADDGTSDDDKDLDYRDELEAERMREKNTDVGRNSTAQKKSMSNMKHGSETMTQCDDGSYKHDHDHHHHSHHDKIKWLQESIPGEPGKDYPILSNISSTNFNCRDQKYPGYYADVDARCQVSVE